MKCKSINPRALRCPWARAFLGNQGEIMLRDAIGYAMLFGAMLTLMLAYFDCLTY